MNEGAVMDETTEAPMRRHLRNAGQVAGGLDEIVSAALDSSPVGLIVLDHELRVRLVTTSAARLLGFEDAGEAAGLPVLRMLAGCHGLGTEEVQALSSALDHAGFEPQEVQLNLKRGGIAIGVDIRQAGPTGWVVSVEDITRSRQTQDWLLEHVSSDPVTGLWNRQHFMLMLQDSLAAGLLPGARPPCLLRIGFGQFKRLTRPLGPNAGDGLLRAAADRIAGLLDDDDMLARFGVDEFAAVLVDSDGQMPVAERCRILFDGLSEPFVVDGTRIALDIQIGAALPTGQDTTSEDLATHAGLALQAASGDHAGGICFFDQGLIERANLRRALEHDLRHALERDEFELHYQPQMDVLRGCVTGLEALIRWRCPRRGLVPPASFIPVAEQIGLICDIGDWVLHEACREAMSWPTAVTVAVNASPLQFETGRFAETVAGALAASGLSACRLEIEITENLLLRETDMVLETLADLEALGVRLVLDDFGTGYASLGQLSRFRFDKIKIDRSFVSPAAVSSHSSAIVRSIAALGVSLGIPTIAEGVETATQLEQIKADGCTCVQGYFFSRPVPAKSVDCLLTKLNSLPA